MGIRDCSSHKTDADAIPDVRILASKRESITAYLDSPQSRPRIFVAWRHFPVQLPLRRCVFLCCTTVLYRLVRNDGKASPPRLERAVRPVVYRPGMGAAAILGRFTCAAHCLRSRAGIDGRTRWADEWLGGSRRRSLRLVRLVSRGQPLSPRLELGVQRLYRDGYVHFRTSADHLGCDETQEITRSLRANSGTFLE